MVTRVLCPTEISKLVLLVATALRYKRRDVLSLTFGGVAASAFLSTSASLAEPAPQAPAPAPAASASPPAAARPVAGPGVILAPPTDFAPSTPADYARQLARQPFKPISSDLPDPFRSLNYEQYAAIKLKPEARIWADETIGFVIEPRHRGFQYANPILLNLVSGDKAYRLVYDIRLYEFGKLAPSAKTGDIGFSGFEVMSPQGIKGWAEIASFGGTNFFQGLAEGQVDGLMARALAIKVLDPKGEEMPYFREIWIEKPSVVADLLVVHAVLDSDSVTGAFRFTIRPGEATIMDTECTLFPRRDLDNYGLASMSATHLLGFMDHGKFNDYRPNVSEVSGVQMLTGANEWVWRPVSNRDELQTSTFIDNKPRGFGCLLRDRNFQDYLDEDNHWERRPSLWIEPLGDWGEGGVQLIEIPSQSDANDNILCFWRPKLPLKAGQEASFAYRQFWCWDPPERPDMALTTRSHSGASGKRRRYFVEFEGDVLGEPERTKGMVPTLTASSGSITVIRAFAVPDRKAFRVLFELDPQGASSSELRLLLEAGGRRLSETWLYRWTPT